MWQVNDETKALVRCGINFWIREKDRLAKEAKLDEEQKERLKKNLEELFKTRDVHVDFGSHGFRKDVYHIGAAIYLAIASALIGKPLKAKVSR